MKERKLCYCGTNPHHDHWECSECHKKIGEMFIDQTWNNCPFCGAPLAGIKDPQLWPFPEAQEANRDHQ